MIYKNTTHTAQEIVDALGVNPFVLGDTEFAANEVIGKARVRIGGISGIVDPEKIVRLSNEDKLEVIVGNKAYELKLKSAPKELNGVSESAQAVIAEEGKGLEKQAEKNQKAKAEARAQAEAE